MNATQDIKMRPDYQCVVNLHLRGISSEDCLHCFFTVNLIFIPEILSCCAWNTNIHMQIPFSLLWGSMNGCNNDSRGRTPLRRGACSITRKFHFIQIQPWGWTGNNLYDHKSQVTQHNAALVKLIWSEQTVPFVDYSLALCMFELIIYFFI